MYAGYPCKFCKRQRVEDDGDCHICEKCRRDQTTGEYVPESDPIDELLRERQPPSSELKSSQD